MTPEEPAVPPVATPPTEPSASADPEPPTPLPGTESSRLGSDAGASGLASPTDRPEVAVGAAFAGGLAVALILRRLAS